MTLVSQIITDAYRETNVIPVSQLPSTDQYSEALIRLETLVLSVIGNEAGEQLQPMALGQLDINAPSGYPWYANSLPADQFIPENTRLMCNLTGFGNVNLHPRPNDGARFGVVDVAQNFSTHNLQVNGNGRNINGLADIVLQTSAFDGEWMYRGDLGNWVTLNNLTLTGTFPFPPEFDDMFVIMLAARLNPRYGQTLDPASLEQLKRTRNQFRARYKQVIPVASEDGLLYMSGDLRYGGRFRNRLYGSSPQFFNTGYPF